MWRHECARAEEIRAWAGVPLAAAVDGGPYRRLPTEAEAAGARALAAWLADLEARGIQVETAQEDPGDEPTWRLFLFGARSLHDVDLPLLFGTPDVPDAADVLGLPAPPVVYHPEDEWGGERLELAPQVIYDIHSGTGERRAVGEATGAVRAPGYVRVTRRFPMVAQAVLMESTRMGASQMTFGLTQLLERYAQATGIPVAYVHAAGEADGVWKEPRAVAQDTLTAVSAAFEEARADWQTLRQALLQSSAEVKAATQIIIAV
jgi:hypothetical protein